VRLVTLVKNCVGGVKNTSYNCEKTAREKVKGRKIKIPKKLNLRFLGTILV
jgi:hypothetical protein